LPNQVLRWTPAVTGGGGIQIDVVPIAIKDLKPFLEAIERKAEGIAIERRRKDTNQLGHGLRSRP
jgi:hypothetical protein